MHQLWLLLMKNGAKSCQCMLNKLLAVHFHERAQSYQTDLLQVLMSDLGNGSRSSRQPHGQKRDSLARAMKGTEDI